METGFLMQPHGYCFANNILLRHGAPFSTIGAIVTVVTHHEVIARRDYPRGSRSLSGYSGYMLGSMLDTVDGFGVQGSW